MLRLIVVGIAVVVLSSCSTPPISTSWEQLAALGPILTVAEVNDQSGELRGKKLIIDAYMSNHFGRYYTLNSQKTEKCSGETGPGWGIPEGEEQMSLWFETNQAPFYARQFSGRRVVLSATMSGEVTTEPSSRGQERSHVRVLWPMRGPLTDIKILRVFKGVCGHPAG